MKDDIRLGTHNDVNELEELYNNLNVSLSIGINYPGWKKGIYPIAQNAIDGINNKSLFVARKKERIIGSVILNHNPEEAYHHSTWAFNSDYSDILVIHTLAVHPDYQKCGVGKELINFAIQYGKEENMKSIRLDVFEKNIPAINLYEKSGFHYVDTVDLGLGKYGLDKFRLYEILLK